MKRDVQKQRYGLTLRFVCASLAIWVCAGATSSFAQLLRLGPFDLNSRARLDAVYSSNVEQERKSEATAEREDYFLVFGMDFFGDAPVSPSTVLRLDTGFAIEKHFVRDDLDNSSSPFGRLRLDSVTELRNLTISAGAGWERKSESAEDVAMTGGRSKKTRNPSEVTDYGIKLNWDNEVFYWGAGYRFSRERYQKQEFKDGDKDETEYTWETGLRLTENLRLAYTGSRKITDMFEPEPDTTKELKQDAALLWTFQMFGHVQFDVSLGYTKDETDDEKEDWGYKHSFGVRDAFDINPRLSLAYGASYTIEEQPEEDDVKFQYFGMLNHEVTSTLRQQLSASREPVKTFGSTQDTDSTRYGYSFTKSDFLIRDLSLNFSYLYEINKPVEGPTEKIKTLNIGLNHRAEITYALSRDLSYLYHREDSSIQPDILDEHRVTWSYVYTF